MLALKRSLTQTEKQKFLVDEPRTIYSENPLISCITIKLQGDKLFECQQNFIEERKYEQKAKTLEKAKNKRIAKLNGEKHAIKMKYRDLLADNHGEFSSDTFYMQPGFRYRRNGDLKRLHSNISEIKALGESEQCEETREFPPDKLGPKSAASQSSSGSGDGFYRNLKDARLGISQIEQQMEKICKDTTARNSIYNSFEDVSVRVRDVKKSLIRARENLHPSKTYEPQQKTDDFEQLYRMKSQATCDRFARHCSKPSCIACEFRFKCGTETHERIPKRKAQTIPWKAAPSGVYVARIPDMKSSPRKALSARSRNAAETIVKCQQRNGTKLARQSKSALPTRNSITEVCEPTEKANSDLKGNDKINTILHRFKKRENIETPKCLPAVKMNYQYSNNASSHMSSQSQPQLNKQRMTRSDSEQVLRVETIQDLQDPSVLSNPSLPYAKNDDVSQPQKDTQCKVEEFLSKLPQVKPSLTTWRNSSGQLMTWRSSHDDREGADSSRPSERTWQQYHSDHGSTSQLSVQLSNNGLKKRRSKVRDPNCVEELAKCRYLRTRTSQFDIEF